MPNGHALLSPSSAHRWVACPGSVEAEKACKTEPSSSPAADLGTFTHSVLELSLSTGKAPSTVVGDYYLDHEITREIADAVSVAYDYVQLRRDRTQSQMLLEQSFDISIVSEECYGTADVVLFNKSIGYLEVIDYKNGVGYVEVKDNPQLLLYAIGAMQAVDFQVTQVIITVVQPNAGGSPVRLYQYSYDEIGAWIEGLRGAATVALSENAARIPSDKACQWCRAKGNCPERTEAALELAREVFAPLAITDDPLQGYDQSKVPTLTPKQIKVIMDSKPFVLSLYKDVEQFVFDELSAGRQVEGYKLVEGNTRRSWTLDDEELRRLFRNTSTVDSKKLTQEQYLNTALVSPAQAEKKIKPVVSNRVWSRIKEAILSSPGKPKVAPESDRKPAVNVKPSDLFEDLTAPSIFS